MNGYEYCEYWIKKYKKSIKTLRSIGFPMELFVSMAGVFTPIIIWAMVYG